MELVTFVQQTEYSPRYAVRTVSKYDMDPTFFQGKFVTTIHPCYVEPYEINWQVPTLPLPLSDGQTMTQQQAMLLHMSTVSHVMTQDAYAIPPAPYLVKGD